MAVLEIQFKEEVFFSIIAAQVVRVNPPAELLNKLPSGMLIEKIETGGVAFAVPGEVLFGDDEIALKVPLTIRLTNYEFAKNAGSLQAPETIPVATTVWLRLQGAVSYLDPAKNYHPTGLRWFIQRVEVNNTILPVLPASRDLPFDPGIPVIHVTLATGSGVVAIRFVTPSGGGGGPVVNRLGTDDWGQFIEGQVFADSLAQQLDEAANSAAAGSSDP